MTNEQVSLFFKNGSSDKVYNIQLIASTGTVNFQYGRRGSTLTSGSKCKDQPYLKAYKIYLALVKEKMDKGYQPGAEGATTYTAPPEADQRKTEYAPQLLTMIMVADVEKYITDDDWIAQQKEDGRRIGVFKRNGKVYGANRKGLEVGIPDTILRAIEELPYDVLLDGEMIGDFYHAFDILERKDVNLRLFPYTGRLSQLAQVIGFISSSGSNGYVQSTITAHSKEGKRVLYETLKKESKEGIVFKRRTAPYVAGRPNSGGSQVKLKFWASASVIVSKINDKRSIAVKVLDNNGYRVEIGNVSVPVNYEMPEKGQVVEVRYLYAYPGGSLFQPQYEGVRDDISPYDCLVNQLKYKSDE